MYVPKNLIKEFITRAHGNVFSGHPGEKGTYKRLSRYAFWPKMRKDINLYVKTCKQCAAYRPNAFKKMVPVRPQVAQFPMDFIVADLVKFHPPPGDATTFLS